MDPKAIIDKGISMSFIPEDRLGMGLAPSLSITDNMMLKTYRDRKKSPFVDRRQARKRANEIIKRLGIVTPSTETPVRRRLEETCRRSWSDGKSNRGRT